MKVIDYLTKLVPIQRRNGSYYYNDSEIFLVTLFPSMQEFDNLNQELQGKSDVILYTRRIWDNDTILVREYIEKKK